MQEKLEKKSLQYFFLVTSLWHNYENKNNSNRKDITWSILFIFGTKSFNLKDERGIKVCSMVIIQFHMQFLNGHKINHFGCKIG